MSSTPQNWAVRLGASAETDIEEILRWTLTQFGEAQTRIYAETISLALMSLASGLNVIGSKSRDEIGKGLSTLHIARNGRSGRHFILYRVAKPKQSQVIEVLRLLHDAMDLARHVPTSGEREK